MVLRKSKLILNSMTALFEFYILNYRHLLELLLTPAAENQIRLHETAIFKKYSRMWQQKCDFW